MSIVWKKSSPIRMTPIRMTRPYAAEQFPRISPSSSASLDAGWVDVFMYDHRYTKTRLASSYKACTHRYTKWVRFLRSLGFDALRIWFFRRLQETRPSAYGRKIPPSPGVNVTQHFAVLWIWRYKLIAYVPRRSLVHLLLAVWDGTAFIQRCFFRHGIRTARYSPSWRG